MFSKIFDKLIGYLQVRFDVLKLSVIERIAVVMGFCMLMILGMMLSSAILLFLGIALSEFFGELTGSVTIGYFIVTGIFALLLVLVFVFKRTVMKWFAGLFVSLLTTDEDDDIV